VLVTKYIQAAGGYVREQVPISDEKLPADLKNQQPRLKFGQIPISFSWYKGKRGRKYFQFRKGDGSERYNGAKLIESGYIKRWLVTNREAKYVVS